MIPARLQRPFSDGGNSGTRWRPCPRSYIRKGEPIPANYGGGISPYPLAYPAHPENTATKPELQGHFDPLYPDFNVSVPDQLRVEEFLTHFRGWVSARKAGKDEMPSFVMLRLPADHTAGTKPGMPTATSLHCRQRPRRGPRG